MLSTGFSAVKETTVQLEPSLVRAWRDGVLALAKFRRRASGKPNVRPENPDFRLRQLLQQELLAIRELWEAFNTDRQNVGRYLSDPKHQAVVYALGFHLANVARVKLALRRAFASPAVRDSLSSFFSESGSVLKMIDLGCGSGAVSHAASAFFRSLGFPLNNSSLTLFDKQGAFLDIAKSIHLSASTFQEKNIFSVKKNLETLDGRFWSNSGESKTTALHVVCIGYLINELLRCTKANTKINDFLSAGVSHNTILVLAESANQSPAREMMILRDRLVQNFGYKVLYPCPAAATSCPMLDLSRDWCFSEGVWNQDKAQKDLDRMMKINRARFATSGFVLISPILYSSLASALQSNPRKRVLVGKPVIAERPVALVCEGGELQKDKELLTKASKSVLRGQQC